MSNLQVMIHRILAGVEGGDGETVGQRAPRVAPLQLSRQTVTPGDSMARKDLLPRHLIEASIRPLAAERFCPPSRNLLFIGSFQQSSIKDPQLEQLETFRGLFPNQPRVQRQMEKQMEVDERKPQSGCHYFPGICFI